MADRKTLASEAAQQENNSLESDLVRSKQQTADSQEKEIHTTIDFNITSSSSLTLARKVLYEHIKAISGDGTGFFVQQDRTYKRELVDIMRRIDKHDITTDAALLDLMTRMAHRHQSTNFYSLLQTLEKMLDVSVETENDLMPPRFP